MAERTRDTWPEVQGRCPACKSRSLFLGSGGYVTCSWMECPNPGMPSDLLEDHAFALLARVCAACSFEGKTHCNHDQVAG